MNQEQLSPGQAARLLGCSTEYVRKLARTGRLPYTMTPLGRLFPSEAVEELARRRGVAQRGRETRGG